MCKKVEEQQLNNWIENFSKEMESIQISFDAFFPLKKIDYYYSLQVNKEHNNLILELKHEDELPKEILNRITAAYSNSKPA
jgi:hypothetical protein